MNTLEIDSVHLAFKKRVILQDIYLQLKTNKVTGLLGKNGYGKSSLLKIIFGTLKAQNVSIRIDGFFMEKLFTKNKMISYLPQFNFIPDSLTIKKVFLDYDISFDEFKRTFPTLNINENNKISNFSSGEKRIIEVFIVLKSKVKICLLDEPFSQIMPLHINAIKSLIWKEKENKAILISDHMYKNVLEICTDVYLIKDKSIYLLKNHDELMKYGYLNDRI